jgi:hypothetical protein
MVPVACEDPVAERAAVEREAHMRAPVVDGVNLIAVYEETQRLPVDVDNQPSRRPQLGKRRGADQRLAADGSSLLLQRSHARQSRTSSKV